MINKNLVNMNEHSYSVVIERHVNKKNRELFYGHFYKISTDNNVVGVPDKVYINHLEARTNGNEDNDIAVLLTFGIYSDMKVRLGNTTYDLRFYTKEHFYNILSRFINGES